MKIRHRVLLFLAVISLATSLLIGLTSLRLLRSSARESLTARFHADTALLAGWVAVAVPPVDPQRLAVEAGRDLGARVTLIAPDGTVLGDSARDAQSVLLMDNHGTRPEVLDALVRGTGESFRLSASTGVEFYYFARRLERSGPVAVVRIALPAVEVERRETRWAWTISGTILVALALVTGFAYLLVRRLSRPIEEIADAAERAEAGRPGIEMPYVSHDEVGRLATSVSRMQRALTGKIGELEDERRLLLSVIGGMKEGLLVVGTDHRIRLSNRAAREALGFPSNPEGRLLAEVARSPALIREIQMVLDEGGEALEEVIRVSESGRSFALHVTPLPARTSGHLDGALVLLFDITRLEALEGVRREFVANVSHELRTPLTSIQAFVETLLDEPHDPAKAREFLGIVQKHANRMRDLIEDLTDLSRIETGSVHLHVQEFDSRALTEEVLSQLRHRAGDDIELRNDLPSPFPVRADRVRLEQALVNLVDNAIKFNRPGGSVTISGGTTPDHVILTVEDTGVGIAADSQEKVFHRFYRVDRARSRELGGTGLGLAIVKHILRLHGGQVRLESELGLGSRFILELPRTAE